LMPDDAEVLGSHTKQSSTVNLGLSPDEVGLLRVQVLAFLPARFLLCDSGCRGIPRWCPS
jgi:hypothetical protein